MKKLTSALIVASLGLALGLGMGLIPAEHGSERPEKGKDRMGCPMKHGKGHGEMGGMMENAKKEEMKRHHEVMRGLRVKAGALQEKIREDLREKIKEIKKQKQDDANEEAGSSSAKIDREEIWKEIIQPYRAEAAAIAGEMTAEILLHHQYMLNILTSGQTEMTEMMTTKILMPKKPGMEKHGKEGKHERMRYKKLKHCEED